MEPDTISCPYLNKTCDMDECMSWGPVITIDAAQDFYQCDGCTRIANERMAMHINFIHWRDATLSDAERVLHGSVCQQHTDTSLKDMVGDIRDNVDIIASAVMKIKPKRV
jgi:hypothetical protein